MCPTNSLILVPFSDAVNARLVNSARYPERESGKDLSKAWHECQEKLPDSGAAGETEIVVGDAMPAF